MPSPDKMTLAEARRTGQLDQFIADHEGDPTGDTEAFNRGLHSMVQKSSEAPKASSRRNRGG